jgi:hypothetical protein
VDALRRVVREREREGERRGPGRCAAVAVRGGEEDGVGVEELDLALGRVVGAFDGAQRDRP